MKYRLAIFDFDGTLADSFPFFMSVFNDLALRHGFREVEPAAVEALRRKSARQVMRGVGLPAWKLPMVARDFRAAMTHDQAVIPLFAGAEQLLQYLAQRGVMLAVVSANSYDNVTRVLGCGNTKLFRLFECGASIFGKAQRLRQVLKKSGMAAPDAIYIGDQPDDILAARAARIASGAVAWGYADMATLKKCKPDQVYSTIDDVQGIAPDGATCGACLASRA